jgi:hypothetical protein
MAPPYPPPTGGFRIPCPNCGAIDDGGLGLRLSDLAIGCAGCEAEISREDLVTLAAECDRLLRWLDLAATA